MSAVPAKIVLKSTTKVTLSDRFTQIQKMRPPPPSPQEVRAQIASNQHSTQQNRRLAQQMANRPAVQAALGQGQGRQQNKQAPVFQVSGFPAQQKSLKQRLGPSNVKARLSLGNGVVRGGGRGIRRGSGFRGGRGQQGSGRGGQYIMNGGPVRGGNRGRGRGRGISNRGQQFSPPRWRDNDRHPRGRGGFGRPGDYSFRGRGGSRGRGGDRGRGGQRGSFRGRGGRGGPRGRGRGGNVQNYSKEQLDNQLEEYMSKSKSHLNQELDDYMAQADN